MNRARWYLFPYNSEQWPLLRQWTIRLLAARYRGSFLGYFWTFANPLLMLAVYTFVFGIVFKARWGDMLPVDNTGSFAVIMFCGMTVFNIFSESVNAGARCVGDNANLVKKVIFPLQILPLAQLLSTTILSLAWFVLLLCGALWVGFSLSWTILLLPLILVPMMLLSLGLTCFAASATVYLRDTPHLVAVVTQVLFFMTPIFYPITLVPEKYRFLLYFNPITPIVEQSRAVLLYCQVPDWTRLAMLWLACGCIYALGIVWFQKTRKGFADVL